MSFTAQEQRGLRLLALDGGGIRGLSELLILHEIMNLLQAKTGSSQLPLPCDHFDLIGGTSTGGLIALMLGRFRMSTQQAIEQYRTLAKNIFSERKKLRKEMFKATNLTEAIKEVVRKYDNSPDGESVMLDSRPNACRTFVCAQSVENIGSPTLFRTYSVPRGGGDRENCKIWEAARATTAAPTFFKPIEMSTRQKYIDAGLGCNNPVNAVLREAKSLFDRPVDCILSIGTGIPTVNSLEEANLVQNLIPVNVIKVLKNLATDCETVANELEERYKDTPGVYIRLNVDQGMQGITLAEWEKDGAVTTHTEKYLARTVASGLIDMAVTSLMGKDKDKALPIDQLLGITSRTPGNKRHRTVPHSVSQLFTGRDYILEHLKDYFFSTDPSSRRRIFVLYGLGGSGKTQISLEFIQRHGDRFWGIFWIDASTQDAAEQSFCEIARELHTEVSPKAAKQRLERCTDSEEWLLVIDNADDPEIDVSTYFPLGNNGKIFVTTRNRECRQHAPKGNLEIDKLQPQEANDLFLKTAMLSLEPDDKQRQLVTNILDKLGYLALAIAQAGAYIANGYTMDDYLELLQDYPKDLLSRRFPQGSKDYERTVFTTWEVSFKAIKEKNPSASEILQLFAFFHYDRIPEDVFRLASNIPRESPKLSEPLMNLVVQRPDGTWDQRKFREAIRTLLSFSLIKQNTYKKKTIYSVHPLVHSWSRNRLDIKDQVAFRSLASTLIECSIDFRPPNDPFFLLQFMPHIESCKEPLRNCDESPKPELLKEFHEPYCFEEVYYAAGKWRLAEELLVAVLDVQRKELGEAHLDTLSSMENLAITYIKQGRWKEAEDLLVVVLDVQRKELGEEHPDTLLLTGNLASTYNNQGRWKEAEDIQVVVLDVLRKELGEAHPDTVQSMNNLAMTYSNQGRWKEAEDLQVVVLDVLRKELGEAHPGTLTSINNLALTYSNQGRWKEAEDLQVVVLDVLRKELSGAHPDTMRSMNNLAMTYNNQGRWKEAEDLQVVVLDVQRKELGEADLSTLTSMNNLAFTYSNQGRWKEAEDLLVVVLDVQRKELGEAHPSSLTSMNNLAMTYSNQGRWKEAENLQVVVLDVLRKGMGEAHPSTLTSMNNLAMTYHNQGRWKEAEDLQVVALDVQRKELGEAHPDTMRSMNNLAMTYSNQERWKEAEDLQVVVLDVQRKELREAHPDTVKSMNNLALTYRNQGRWKEAEDLQVVVLDVLRKELSGAHPDTMTSMNNLALTYSSQGRWKEAEDLQVAVLDIQRKEPGEAHPDTMRSMNNLAMTYRNQERWKEAEDLLVVVVETGRKVLNETHPNLLRYTRNLAMIYEDQGREKEAAELRSSLKELETSN